MNRIKLLFVTLIFIGNFLYAQERGGEQLSTDQKAENFVIKLNEKIHLNKIKSDSVTLIFKNFYEAMQTYRTEGNMEVVKLFVQRRDKGVQDILMNDDKYAIYIKLLDDLRKERQRQHQQNSSEGGRRGGMGRPGGMGGGMGGMRQPGF